jgi:enterochelin esterase-like enzyme
MKRCAFRAVVILLLSSACVAQQAAKPLRFAVTISSALGSAPVSGRLLVLLSTRAPRLGYLEPGFGSSVRDTWIAAREVDGVLPGQTVTVDARELAFPAPLSTAPPGDYYAMAMLDVNHQAAYRFFTAGDLRSKAVVLAGFHPGSAGRVRLTLNERVPAKKPVPLPPGMESVDFTSSLLSSFYRRPIHMRAVVVLPPSYTDKSRRFPTVYLIPGFGAKPEDLPGMFGEELLNEMSDRRSPEMIYVLLDESLPTGTHEFADSVNNGPWGTALVNELIPYLEAKYRMQAEPGGRFLTGHSSGGWATLWLQVTHPDFFGGTWSTSPDPVDFRSFTGPDIADAKPGSNAYLKPDGSPWMLVRERGKEVESLRDYAQQERVLGDYGGQMSSFEWVFSPRGRDGRPEQLFDRVTGLIDTGVAHAWEEYDIARILRDNWPSLGPKLQGKIHIYVGDADSFHLDSSVALLDKELKELGAGAEVISVPGRNHFDLYQGGLSIHIAKEMYSAAHGQQAGASSGK